MGQLDTRGKWTYLRKIQILMYIDRVLPLFLFCMMQLRLRKLINTENCLNIEMGESYRMVIENTV